MSDITESHLVLAHLTDALFCSELETGDTPTRRQLAAAIRMSLRAHRNWNGCTRAVAAEFANNPDDAERREAWCRQIAEAMFNEVNIKVDPTRME